MSHGAVQRPPVTLLSAAQRRLYLAEMGIDVYVTQGAFVAEPDLPATLAGSKPASTVSESAKAPADDGPRPGPSLLAARQKLAESSPQRVRPAPVDEQQLSTPKPSSGQVSQIGVRCFGAVGSQVAVLLQAPDLPQVHPLSFSYRRSLGAVLRSLEINPERVLLICMTPGVELQQVRTSLPPGVRLVLAFAVEPALLQALDGDVLMVDAAPPPAHPSPDWKRRIWPALRNARRRLALRCSP